jgi:hypothetical protein
LSSILESERWKEEQENYTILKNDIEINLIKAKTKTIIDKKNVLAIARYFEFDFEFVRFQDEFEVEKLFLYLNLLTNILIINPGITTLYL